MFGIPTIRAIRHDEFARLGEIEIAAGRAFAGVGMPEIAGDEPFADAEMRAFVTAGHAWAAAGADDRAIAYLVAAPVDECLHVEQVSVDPGHARRGIGATLIDHLADVARAEGRPALTLTTFAGVPWNAPYYARLGFAVIEPADYGPQLAALVVREARHIPGDAPRVAMRRAV